MSRFKGQPPVYWRCPECRAEVTSKFAKKRHACGFQTAHDTIATAKVQP